MAQWQSICLPMQETQETGVRSLGWEDPQEKDKATHSIILVCKIAWTEEPGGLYSPWDCQESDTTEHAQRGRCHNLTRSSQKKGGSDLFRTPSIRAQK